MPSYHYLLLGRVPLGSREGRVTYFWLFCCFLWLEVFFFWLEERR